VTLNLLTATKNLIPTPASTRTAKTLTPSVLFAVKMKLELNMSLNVTNVSPNVLLSPREETGSGSLNPMLLKLELI